MDKGWLEAEAEAARSNEDLARRFIGECRRTLTILPGVSVRNGMLSPIDFEKQQKLKRQGLGN